MPDFPPCDDCNGRCCRWILIAYAEYEAEVSKLRGGRLIQIDGKPRYWAFPVACAMLTQGGLCKIYSHRPRFCRENPEPGSIICALTRALEKQKEGIINLL